MKSMKTVGIKMLRDKLSLYLREIKSGVTILITDRDEIIAELHKPSLSSKLIQIKSIQSEWILQGKLVAPKTLKKAIQPSTLKIKQGTSQMLLDLDRGF
jgi:antitoxin (DNA-binding transcriptional repressor) of toxin-antitoxin stability system